MLITVLPTASMVRCTPGLHSIPHTLKTMKTIIELIHEANRIAHNEVIGEITVDGILIALATLEAASGKRTRRAPDEFQPADHDAVANLVANLAEDVVTAATVYRELYGRAGTTAELRTASEALRACGWVPYKSTGRTKWRRKSVAEDGLYGLANGSEIYDRVTAWADSMPHFRDTASTIFRRVMGRDPTAIEARAAGAALRDLGIPSRRTNGSLTYEKRA